jgi:hypothetical protein
VGRTVREERKENTEEKTIRAPITFNGGGMVGRFD